MRVAAAAWAEFNDARPRIIGAFLDAVSCAIRELPNVGDHEWPRLADLARWVTAGEPALGWRSGSFLRALGRNRHSAAARALAAEEPLATHIRQLAAQSRGWTGTATNLYEILTESQPAPRLPAAPNALSNKLKRLAPAFRQLGVEVNFFKQGHESVKYIELTQGVKNIAGIDGIDSEEETEAGESGITAP